MNEEINSQVQTLAMIIIANSGEAKAHAFEALRTLREDKDFNKSREFLNKAKELVNEAHLSQTKLLTQSASDEGVTVDVLLVHAQDHLMTTMMAVELIEEMILLVESM